MLQQNTSFSRRLLSLLFIAAFLLNIQASYACAMMPDMASETIECCCGPSHRMVEMTDHGDTGHSDMAGMPMHHGPQVNADQHDHGPVCNDPQMACCNVEVSVGINDPPSDDADALTSLTKPAYPKQTKQLDTGFVAAPAFWVTSSPKLRETVVQARPPDLYLQFTHPPLYKTTERYRI